MTLAFTPYTYLFFSIYCVFLGSLLSLSSFYIFWLFMELMTLLLMGLSYTLFVNSVSFLLIYFLVQSASSFVILLAYILNSSILFTVAVLLNLGMFPFFAWYMSSVNRFPNFVFWLTGTLHNLPVLIIIGVYNLSLVSMLFWASVILTTFVAASFMLFTLDFRWLLVASSVGNNSWFLLAQQSDLIILFSYLFVYALFLGSLLSSLGVASKPTGDVSFSSYKWVFYLLCISGLPPFPLFFLKLCIVYFILLENIYLVFLEYYLVAVFLVANALIVAGYIRYLINHQVYVFSNSLSSVI